MSQEDWAEPGDRQYVMDVGRRLRDVRRQQGLSLQQVAVRSAGSFSPSILGAYERGERALSVGRLAALARLYGVDASVLLPPPSGSSVRASPASRHLTVDLARLSGVETDEWDLLRRYLRTIQEERGDLNGRVLSVRHDDLRAMAVLCFVPVDDLLERLRGGGFVRS